MMRLAPKNIVRLQASHWTHMKRPITSKQKTILELTKQSRSVSTSTTSPSNKVIFENASDLLRHIPELGKHFDRLEHEENFVDKTYQVLERYGFSKGNSIPLVGLCRDELTGSLFERINSKWHTSEHGNIAFYLNSLAGMVLVGSTGITAGISHSPMDSNGHERYVFFNFSHIGVDIDKKIVGTVTRPGIAGDTVCCGAIRAFHDELKAQNVKLDVDLNDLEYSVMKNKLMNHIPKEKAQHLSMLDITHLAYETSKNELKQTMKKLASTRKCDYAIFSGIQIHTGERTTYLWTGDCSLVQNGGEPIQIKI